MQENEKILLDARLVSMIKSRVFRADIRNGHGFVAFCKSRCVETAGKLEEGDRVRVQFSPFDMSKAEIVEKL